jgi:DNA polymerase III epsilon subunit-like protein
MNTYDINVMVDLETLGTSPRSTILSIGAVEFSCRGIEEVQFYRECCPQQLGRSIQISTLQWWFGQKIKPPIYGTTTIDTAVAEFNQYLQNKIKEASSRAQIILWANGIDFDWGLLKEVMEDYFMKSPVKYNNVRDYRTLARLHSSIQRPEMPPDLAHNALQDAKAQALHCVELLKHVGYW